MSGDRNHKNNSRGFISKMSSTAVLAGWMRLLRPRPPHQRDGGEMPVKVQWAYMYFEYQEAAPASAECADVWVTRFYMHLGDGLPLAKRIMEGASFNAHIVQPPLLPGKHGWIRPPTHPTRPAQCQTQLGITNSVSRVRRTSGAPGRQRRTSTSDPGWWRRPTLQSARPVPVSR